MASTRHIGVSPSDIDIFFEKLGIAFRNEHIRLGRTDIPDYTDEKFWELREKRKDSGEKPPYVATEEFGNKGAGDPLYFFLKWKNKTTNKDGEIPLRAEAIINALIYLKRPGVSFPDGYKIDGNYINAAKYLWQKFMDSVIQNSNQTDEVLESVEVKKDYPKTKEEKRQGNLLGIIPSQTDDFIGRKKELENLYEVISKSNNIVFLHGIPGIGKTSLMKTFIERYRYHFDNFAWINMGMAKEDDSNEVVDDPLILERGLIQLYNDPHNDKANNKHSIISQFRYVVSELNKTEGNNLLIIDNYDQTILSDRFKNKLPHNSVWKIIVTGRAEVAGLKNIPLGKLSIDDAKSLFRQFCDKNIDEVLLVEFLKEIDRHTLMIEIAAKTLNESNSITLEYLYEKLLKGQLDDPNIDRHIGTEYSADEARLIDQLLCLFDIKSLSQEEINILRTWYYLPPDSYTVEDISRFTAIPIELNALLISLSKKGWIKFNSPDNTYSIHRLIQKTILYSLSPKVEDINTLLSFYKKKFIVKENETAPIFQGIDFIEQLIDKIQNFELTNPIIGELVHYQSFVYDLIELHHKAIACLEKLITSYDKAMMPERWVELAPQKVMALLALSSLLIRSGEFDGAEKRLQEVLQLVVYLRSFIDKNTLDETIAHTYKKLIEVYHHANDEKGIEFYLEKLRDHLGEENNDFYQQMLSEVKLIKLIKNRDFKNAWSVHDILFKEFTNEFEKGLMPPGIYARKKIDRGYLLEELMEFDEAISSYCDARDIVIENALAHPFSYYNVMLQDALLAITDLLKKKGDMEEWAKNEEIRWKLCINELSYRPDHWNIPITSSLMLATHAVKPIPDHIVAMVRESLIAVFLYSKEGEKGKRGEKDPQNIIRLTEAVLGYPEEDFHIFLNECISEAKNIQSKRLV